MGGQQEHQSFEVLASLLCLTAMCKGSSSQQEECLMTTVKVSALLSHLVAD